MSTTTPHKYAELGQRLRRARKRAGISQENLAVSVGITRRHLIRLENGEHLASRDLRNRIAAETGAKSEDLRSEEDDEDPHRPLTLDESLQLRIDEILRDRLERSTT